MCARKLFEGNDLSLVIPWPHATLFALFVVLEIESDSLLGLSWMHRSFTLGKPWGPLAYLWNGEATGVLSEISTNSTIAGAWGFRGHNGPAPGIWSQNSASQSCLYALCPSPPKMQPVFQRGRTVLLLHYYEIVFHFNVHMEKQSSAIGKNTFPFPVPYQSWQDKLILRVCFFFWGSTKMSCLTR